LIMSYRLGVSVDKQIDEILLPVEGEGRAELKKFYTWTLEDANRAQKAWEREHKSSKFAVGPLFRWIAAQDLKELYSLYQAKNDPKVAIEALYLCSLRNLPIPQWCGNFFIYAVREIKRFKAKSWDEPLGKPFPKGTHLYAERKRREKGLYIYNEISEIKSKNPKTPIDAGLFEQIGKKFGVSKSSCEDYYYDFKKKYNIE